MVSCCCPHAQGCALNEYFTEVQLIWMSLIQGRPVMVLCNLKARNMRGIKSDGMLLCASNDTHEIVEPLMPPEDSKTGERVAYGDDETATQPEPETPNKVQTHTLFGHSGKVSDNTEDKNVESSEVEAVRLCTQSVIFTTF